MSWLVESFQGLAFEVLRKAGYEGLSGAVNFPLRPYSSSLPGVTVIHVAVSFIFRAGSVAIPSF